MSVDGIFHSKLFKGIVIVLVILLILGLIFRLGMMVGGWKAEFSHSWGDNYQRNFLGLPGDSGPMGMMGLNDRDFMNGHGVFGKIVQINDGSFVINDNAGTEKNILVKTDTVIKRFKDTINLKDLKTDETVAVVGMPDSQGRIEAKIVRVMPADMPPAPDSQGKPVPGSQNPGGQSLTESQTQSTPATTTGY
jgi:hypothetical protein